MGKTKTRRHQKHQKMYKMKGCSRKNRKCRHLGGSADVNLAYPSTNVHSVPNPYLAYTGKGGANINGVNPTQPNTGPVPIVPATPFLNSSAPQKGGDCGCGGMPLMNGGFMVGGKKHRKACKCNSCKKMRRMQRGGNPGYPIPNGLTGSPWVGGDLSTWPGVAGVQGGNNHFSLNKYDGVDPQTSMISTGANPPFSVGGRGTRRRRQKGGNYSNILLQDVMNLGRQFQYGLGSTYNALAGYAAPANPMPWKDQLPNTPTLSTIKTHYR
jgi:hypothetical protein